MTNLSFSVGLHKRVRYEHLCTSHLFVIGFCDGGAISTSDTLLERLHVLSGYSVNILSTENGISTVKIYVVQHTEQRRAISRAHASVS